MIVLTNYRNDKRMAINPDDIIAVHERDGKTTIDCRLSATIQTTDGILFIDVNETFDEVMKAIRDYHDDRRRGADEMRDEEKRIVASYLFRNDNAS